MVIGMQPCGWDRTFACPVGKQISNGDPVFWMSDDLIQGAYPGDSQYVDTSFQGIGLPMAEDGLGGGWALCFA